MALETKEIAESEHIATIEGLKEKIYFTKRDFMEQASAVGQANGMGDMEQLEEFSILEKFQEFKASKEQELTTIIAEFESNQQRLLAAKDAEMQITTEENDALKDEQKKNKIKIRNLFNTREQIKDKYKKLDSKFKQIVNFGTTLSNVSTNDIQANVHQVLQARSSTERALKALDQKNELDFDAKGDVEGAHSVQEVRPKDLDIKIDELNGKIKQYKEDTNTPGILPILDKENPINSFINDILPKLDERNVDFIIFNEEKGTLELTEEIDYEEGEEGAEVEVTLPNGTEINTLEDLNKVIKFLLQKTIKIKAISQKDFVSVR